MRTVRLRLMSVLHVWPVTRKIFMDRVSKLFDYMVNDKLLHKNVILHDCRDGGPVVEHPVRLLRFYYVVILWDFRFIYRKV